MSQVTYRTPVYSRTQENTVFPLQLCPKQLMEPNDRKMYLWF